MLNFNLSNEEISGRITETLTVGECEILHKKHGCTFISHNGAIEKVCPPRERSETEKRFVRLARENNVEVGRL